MVNKNFKLNANPVNTTISSRSNINTKAAIELIEQSVPPFDAPRSAN